MSKIRSGRCRACGMPGTQTGAANERLEQAGSAAGHSRRTGYPGRRTDKWDRRHEAEGMPDRLKINY